MRQDVQPAGKWDKNQRLKINGYCESFLKERVEYIKSWHGLDIEKINNDFLERINYMLVLKWLQKDLNPWTGDTIKDMDIEE